MPTQTAIDQAKDQFLKAIEDALDTLKTSYGYSHERATGALLCEIGKDDATRPSDSEVYVFMEKHGYGLEEANKILTVEKAVGRLLETNSAPETAIRALTQQISLSNLLNECHTEASISTILPRADVRIDRVDLQSPSKLQQQPANNKKTRASSKAKTTSKSQNKSAKLASGRKRPMEEITASVESNEAVKVTPTSRTRADSVTEEIDAKVSATQMDTPSVLAQAVRPKRIAEPNGVTPGANKRLRSSDNGR